MNKIFEIVSGLLVSDKFLDLFKGKEKKAQEFQLALIEELRKNNDSQIELNKIEAANQNIFVSGWRPFIGWISGVAIAYQFILRDLINYVLVFISNDIEPPPALEIDQLISILLAMLGMAGFRTYEKLKKV